jgi:hypothetical protein
MLVPEASMHKNGGLPLGENDIGTARQSPAMQRKPKTHTVKKRSDVSLRAGIGTPDPAHIPAAFLRCQSVHVIK